MHSDSAPSTGGLPHRGEARVCRLVLLSMIVFLKCQCDIMATKPWPYPFDHFNGGNSELVCNRPLSVREAANENLLRRLHAVRYRGLQGPCAPDVLAQMRPQDFSMRLTNRFRRWLRRAKMSAMRLQQLIIQSANPNMRHYLQIGNRH